MAIINNMPSGETPFKYDENDYTPSVYKDMSTLSVVTSMYVDKYAYIGSYSSDGYIYKYDLDGNLLWCVIGRRGSISCIYEYYDYVYVGKDYAIYKLDSTNGDVVWDLGLKGEIRDIKVDPDGYIYVSSIGINSGYDDVEYISSVQKIDETGKIIWTYNTGNDDPRRMAIDYDNSCLYVATSSGLCKISLSGSLSWKYGSIAFLNVVIGSDHQIYAISDSKPTCNVFKIDISANMIWNKSIINFKFSVFDSGVISNLLVASNGYIYIGSTNYIYSIDNKGSMLHSYSVTDLMGDIYLSPNSIIYAVDNNDKIAIHRFDLKIRQLTPFIYGDICGLYSVKNEIYGYTDKYMIKLENDNSISTLNCYRSSILECHVSDDGDFFYDYYNNKNYFLIQTDIYGNIKWNFQLPSSVYTFCVHGDSLYLSYKEYNGKPMVVKMSISTKLETETFEIEGTMYSRIYVDNQENIYMYNTYKNTFDKYEHGVKVWTYNVFKEDEDNIAIDDSGMIYIISTSRVHALDMHGILLHSYNGENGYSDELANPRAIVVSGEYLYIFGTSSIFRINTHEPFPQPSIELYTEHYYDYSDKCRCVDEYGNIYITERGNKFKKVGQQIGNFKDRYTDEQYIAYDKKVNNDGSMLIYVKSQT